MAKSFLVNEGCSFLQIVLTAAPIANGSNHELLLLPLPFQTTLRKTHSQSYVYGLSERSCGLEGSGREWVVCVCDVEVLSVLQSNKAVL